MEQKKIEEYYRNMKKMVDSFYGFGEVVMSGSGMDDDTITTLSNLDLLLFLQYLCEDRTLNDDEIRFVQRYTQIDTPPQFWSKVLSDLNIDLAVSRIPQMFDTFIEFDNLFFRQGEHRSIGGTIINIYQAIGVGFEGADGVINKKDLDKLTEYITELKQYYLTKYIGNEPLKVDPINPEVIKILSYSTDSECDGISVAQNIEKKELQYFNVRFMGKTYNVPEDAAVFLRSREFVGKELIKLIKESTDMIKRYADMDASKFFENFDVEIQRYQAVMMEACQDIVDDLISRDIYDVSVTDLAERLSGFNAVQELGNKAMAKAISEMQKLVEIKKTGESSAYKSAASTITGSGLRVFTNSFASLMVYSAVEKRIMLSQAKKADQQYERAVQKIQRACEDTQNQICTSILINDFGLGLVEVIENFNNELVQNYLVELMLHGQFDLDNIEEYSENRSNAILENISKASDKRKLLIQAYEACPFNIDVYEKMLEMGYFDVAMLKDAKQIFPVETLKTLVEAQMDNSSEQIEKLDEYVDVLTDYLNVDEQTVLKKYFSKSAEALVLPFSNIKKVCGDLHQFDSWVRKNISENMDEIVEINDDRIYEIAENWFRYQVDSEKIVKLSNAGIYLFDEIQLDDHKEDSYEKIRKSYTDMLTKILKEYIHEARKRKKIYEGAYEKYNFEFDRQKKIIEELKSELKKTGLFMFSKKKELKEKILKQQAELNNIKEPIDLKTAYFDMYK